MTLQIHTNVPLAKYTTMGLGGKARFMTDIHSVDELRELTSNAREQNLPLFILGGGSNTIARDEGFTGVVARNRIMGYEVIEQTPAEATIKVGGGENWDATVKKTVDAGWSGIEALSAIPGTVGAAPVQNIGAYGEEVADAIVSVEAYDLTTDTLVQLSNEECQFAYRHSIFRGEAAGRYCIVSVTMRLSTAAPKPPFYAAVEAYFAEHNVTIFTAQSVRDAVIDIRKHKLPDPAKRPNTGSFFKNAIIKEWLYNELVEKYPDMPSYAMPEKHYKIPTGWLIEQTGLKGQLLHGMRVHDRNALVLINESATSYADLSAAREAIKDKVRDMFRIELEQEPLEI